MIVDNGFAIATQGSSIISGNYIGIDEDGVTANGNTNGIFPRRDHDVIGYNGNGCSAAAQRNIISSQTGTYAIRLRSNRGDFTTIAGNYIGTDASGLLDRGNDAYGIWANSGTNDTIIGTNGDGVNDDLEGNLIAGNGIGIYLQGVNALISGNRMGTNLDGSAKRENAQTDIFVANGQAIIGWCDTSVSALCSDGGSQADSANELIGTFRAIELRGAANVNAIVYGNYIGELSDGTSFINTHNPTSGILLNSVGINSIIGGPSSDQRNVIGNMETGIQVYTSLGLASVENVVIENNSIEDNDVGIKCFETTEFQTVFPHENAVTGNSITNSTESGIELLGCSWDITNNTFDSNTEFGITSQVTYRSDHGGAYANPYDSLSPSGAVEDLESIPNIAGNTFSNNGSGGIQLLESQPVNNASLYEDNTFTNNNNIAVQRDWFLGLELVRQGALQTTGLFQVTLTPSAGTCTGSCFGNTGNGTLDEDNNMWGNPDNTNFNTTFYDDAATWFQVSSDIVEDDGTAVDMNPYLVTVDGAYRNNFGSTYSVDGIDNDTASAVGSPNGVPEGGMFRYQIAEVAVSSIPDQPTNSSPSNGATSVSRTPTLTTSAFSDTDEAHASTEYEVYSSMALCAGAGSGDVYSASLGAVTSHTIPASNLASETTYYWKARYINTPGNLSTYSNCTSFTTIRTQPTFTGTIADLTWDEDSSANNAFDLDTYFSDVELETLTFTYSSVEPDVTMAIDVNNEVSFTSTADWFGSSDIFITACDTDFECVSSNTFTATVNSVNDIPSDVVSGFTPANGDRSSAQTPTIQWDPVTDIDHTSDLLIYTVRIGTSANPDSSYDQEVTSAAGDPSVTIPVTLTDETDFYYTVRSEDPDGAASGWSTVQEFTVNTSLDPEILLTKEITVVNRETAVLNSINTVIQNLTWLPIPLPVYGQVGGTSAVGAIEILITSIIWLSIGLAITSFVGLLYIARSPKKLKTILLKYPSLSFLELHDVPPEDSSIQISYTQFKRNVTTARSVLVVSIVSLFAATTVQAFHEPIVYSGIQAITSTITAEPGDYVDVTVRYSNSGDGDLTLPILTDTLPFQARLISGGSVSSLAAADLQAVQYNLDTINAAGTGTNSSGSVTYRVRLQRQLAKVDSISFTEAELTGNEIITPVQSNAIQLNITRSRLAGKVRLNKQLQPGITITLLEDGEVIATTTTNDDGSYTFEGVGSGTYQITATGEGIEVGNETIQVETGTDNEDVDFDFELTETDDTDNDTEEDPEDDNSEEEDDNETTDDDSDDTEESVEEETTEAGENEDDTYTDTDETTSVEVTQPTITSSTDTPINPSVIELEPTDEIDNGSPTPSVPSEPLTKETTEPAATPYIEISTVTGATSTRSGFTNVWNDISNYLFDRSTIRLEGVTEPNSRLTINICFTTLETESDSQGKWVMEIPKEYLLDGDNTLLASVETNGEVSDTVALANVQVDTSPQLSRTAFFGVIIILLLVVLLQAITYTIYRKRTNQSAMLIAVAMADAVALLVLAGVIYLLYFSSLTVAAEQVLSNVPQNLVDARIINTVSIENGSALNPTEAQFVELSGQGNVGDHVAITICEDRPIDEVTIPASGTWNTKLPITDFPEATFQLSSQRIIEGEYEPLQPLADMDIARAPIRWLVTLLVIMHYVTLAISLVYLWKWVTTQRASTGQ